MVKIGAFTEEMGSCNTKAESSEVTFDNFPTSAQYAARLSNLRKQQYEFMDENLKRDIRNDKFAWTRSIVSRMDSGQSELCLIYHHKDGSVATGNCLRSKYHAQLLADEFVDMLRQKGFNARLEDRDCNNPDYIKITHLRWDEKPMGKCLPPPYTCTSK